MVSFASLSVLYGMESGQVSYLRRCLDAYIIGRHMMYVAALIEVIMIVVVIVLVVYSM